MEDEKPVPINIDAGAKPKPRLKVFGWALLISFGVLLLTVLSIKKQPTPKVRDVSTESRVQLADPKQVDSFETLTTKAMEAQLDPQTTPCSRALVGYVRAIPGKDPEACAPTPDNRGYSWQPKAAVMANHVPLPGTPVTYGSPYTADPYQQGSVSPYAGAAQPYAPAAEPAPVQHGEDTNVVMSFRAQPTKEDAERSPAVPDRPTPMPVSTKTKPDAPKDPNDFDSATGKKYRIFEGTILPCTLVNRLNGAFAGPVNCLISEDILSHDHQHILIPQGSVAIGDVGQVNNTNQQRLFVAFHRLIMPDGYAISLDKFKGLDQIGETALRDKVNHHYLQIFGASVAIAAVAGLAEIGNFGNTAYSASSQYRAGVTENLSESSMQVLEKFISVLPTFTIREGARVKVYISQDIAVPDIKNHTMPGDL